MSNKMLLYIFVQFVYNSLPMKIYASSKLLKTNLRKKKTVFFLAKNSN